MSSYTKFLPAWKPVMTIKPIRVNIGCGRYPLEGWCNIDSDYGVSGTFSDLTGDLFDFGFAELEAVRMSHVLEHISWRESVRVLSHIHSWMAAGGTLTVEVPDMEEILPRGTEHPLWFKYIYGDQSHDGEYHKAGFTHLMLRHDLEAAGWKVVKMRRFESDHKGREGMPCLEAVARA